jgi:transposase
MPNIPARANRNWRPCFSKALYRERNPVERFCGGLKPFRRIAARYEKLASIRLWLRAYESTA